MGGLLVNPFLNMGGGLLQKIMMMRMMTQVMQRNNIYNQGYYYSPAGSSNFNQGYYSNNNNYNGYGYNTNNNYNPSFDGYYNQSSFNPGTSDRNPFNQQYSGNAANSYP